MIRFEGVEHRYGEVEVLRGIDVRVGRGEALCLSGPSGAGKSTLLLVAGAMLRPSRGRVELDGTDVYALAPAARAAFRAAHVGFVFQLFHLVPYLSLRDNLLLARSSRPRAEATRRAEELLERVGLAHRREHRPAALSAGERQRAAVARALLNDPDVVLADEPTGNLDPASAGEVHRLLTEFREGGGAVLLVTHGAPPEGLADRTRVLRDGALCGPDSA